MQAAPDTNLPEIGRVRANTPACTAMRDLVLPAAKASRRADTRFLAIGDALPAYATALSDDIEGRTSPIITMRLSRLEQATSQIMDDLNGVSKILGDPRLSSSVADPLVQRERTTLEALYEAQMARAGLIREFVTRQQVANGRSESDKLAAAEQVKPAVTPMPFASHAPDNLPTLTGIDVRDAEAVREWSRDLTTLVHRSEVDAVKELVPIASACE